MDWISNFDRSLFHALNHNLTSPFLDVLMPFITDKSHFVLIIIVITLVVFLRGKRKDIRGLVLVALVVLTSDFLAASLKEVFVRVRPCHALEEVRLLVGCGGSYSLPSGHATNIFAAMVFLSTRYKKYTPAFLAVAVAIAYSRVYVGVHYPLDTVAGAALGTLCALAYSEVDRRAFQAVIDYCRHKRWGRGGN